jgi:hypothetical protein
MHFLDAGVDFSRYATLLGKSPRQGCLIYEYLSTSTESVTATNFREKLTQRSGPGSSVGIATDYGLDGPGIESW